MPELVHVPQQLTLPLQSQPLMMGDEIISPDYAASLVTESFDHSERYRNVNHDRRWKTNDALYFGYVPQRFWAGTKTPRASLGVPITFSQIHAAYPLVTSALFGTAGDWFDVLPLPGATIDEATAKKATLMYALEHPYDDFGGSGVNELKLAVLTTLKYGNGYVFIQFDPATKLPFIEWLDNRDLYLDPGAKSPSIESCRFAIYRKKMTVDELSKLRGQKGMKIPSDLQLYALTQETPVTIGDITLRQSESFRGMQYNPGADGVVPMPSDRWVEVLIYYSKTRVIWVLNRKWTAFNEKNELGFLPFAGAPCYIVPGRHYAQGIPDVQESNQRYSEAILNGRLDQINLTLDAPRVRKRGTVMTPSQMYLRPGALFESENPSEDFIRQEPSDVTGNIYQELSYIEAASEKLTGINGALSQGTPVRSNASRTNAGINVQTQGPMSRISEIIENVEQYLVLPMLYKMEKMIEYYNVQQPGGPATLPGYIQGQPVNVNTQAAFNNKQCRFEMLAATKMMTREKLAQAFPMIAQTILSGQFMAELSKIGQTVNFQDVFKMFVDATGTAGKYNFVRPMSPQEQQAMMQPPPQIQAQMQMKQADNQTRKDIATAKNQTTLAAAAIEHHQKSEQQAEQSALELLNLMSQAQQGALTPPAPGQPAPAEAAQ